MTTRKSLALVLFVAIIAPVALANISEPDHVFYGTVLNNGAVVTTGTVSVRINGESTAAATYELGSTPAFGTKYVLRVPTSSGTPRLTGTAQAGDQAAFYLGAKLVGSATLGVSRIPQLVDLDANFQGIPTISVADILAVEGDTGTSNATFTISLNFAVISDVTVDYATANGTAVAPKDYVSKSGKATITAGQTSTTVTVLVNGNTAPEDNRVFTLTLSKPTLATIARGTASGTIVDDDGIPKISIGDASGQEGTAATFIHFPVTMTSVARTSVTVDYVTAGITAVSGSHFKPASGKLTIPAGSITGTIDVEIIPDGQPSGDVTLSVTISNPVGATLDRAVGTGTIIDADRLLTFIEVQRLGTALPGLRGVSGLAISPRGEHLYAAAPVDNSIHVFARNPLNGKLTSTQLVQNGAGGASGIGGVRALTISGDGKNLYAAGSTDSAIAVYGRDTATGQLSFIELHKNGFSGALGLRGVRDIAITRDGAHVYAVSSDENSVAVFSRNAATGRLSFVEARFQGVSGFDGLTGAASVAVSSDTSRNVYVGSPTASALAVLRRDASTGALTFVEMQKNGAGGLSGLLGLMPVALATDGKTLYAGALTDRAFGVFSRNLTTGGLTFMTRYTNAAGGVDGLSGIASIVPSADGRFVFAAGAVDDALAVFSRDRSTGALTFREVEKNGNRGADGLRGATAIAVSPDSQFVYVAGAAEDAIAAFRINSTRLAADPNGDGQLAVSDIFYLVNYYLANGPVPVGGADVNGDGLANVTDVFYLVNYFFAGGPPPK